MSVSLQKMKPLVVGHRGASAYALENTLSSFQLAIELGADMVELDVRESLDGKFMVVHDRDLRRVSDSRDVVQKTHSKILRSRELHNQERLMLLEEVFDCLPVTIGMMVELKSVRSYQRMADLITVRAKQRSIVLASFDISLIKRVQEYSLSLPIGIVSHSLTNIAKARRIGINLQNACLDFQVLNQMAVKELRLHKIKTFAWTVDRIEDIRRIMEMGVDGIVSNRPDEVRRIIGDLQ